MRALRFGYAMFNTSVMSNSAPKPGPHLHPVETATTAPREGRPMFRDLAKRHAAEASDYLNEAVHLIPGDARDELLALADVSAQVSLACSSIAPVPPVRPVHTGAGK